MKLTTKQKLLLHTCWLKYFFIRFCLKYFLEIIYWLYCIKWNISDNSVLPVASDQIFISLHSMNDRWVLHPHLVGNNLCIKSKQNLMISDWELSLCNINRSSVLSISFTSQAARIFNISLPPSLSPVIKHATQTLSLIINNSSKNDRLLYNALLYF